MSISNCGVNDGRHLGHSQSGLFGHCKSTSRLENKFLGIKTWEQLEVVQGVGTQNVRSCNIVDHRLPGLQHVFSSLDDSGLYLTSNWGNQFAQLSSLVFGNQLNW